MRLQRQTAKMLRVWLQTTAIKQVMWMSGFPGRTKVIFTL